MKCKNCNKPIEVIHIREWCPICVASLIVREEPARESGWKVAFERWTELQDSRLSASDPLIRVFSESLKEAFQAGWGARGLAIKQEQFHGKGLKELLPREMKCNPVGDNRCGAIKPRLGVGRDVKCSFVKGHALIDPRHSWELEPTMESKRGLAGIMENAGSIQDVTTQGKGIVEGPPPWEATQYRLLTPVHPEKVARWFLDLHHYWFDGSLGPNAFYGCRELATTYLHQWVKTGTLPPSKTQLEIHIESKFDEWLRSSWKMESENLQP